MDFNGLENLYLLNLSHNSLSRVPSATFHFLTNLTTLSLASNLFRKLVPRMFFKLEKLELLDLSGNPLEEIHPDDLKDIKSLKYLYLSRCNLEKIHSLIYEGLPSLVELDLGYNQFSYIAPREFKYLSKLKHLDLRGNKVSVIIDNTFNGLLQLQTLSLSHNSITAISSCAFCNSSIKQLDISANKFTSFQPKVLEPLAETLSLLNVNENQNLIDSATSLAYLIQPLKKLTYLFASRVNLEDSLPETAFYNMQSLILLNVSNNRLVNVSSKLFEPLVRLETFDLSNNDIYSLSERFIQVLQEQKRLVAIYLHGNPWSCFRCHLLPLMDWISSSPSPYFNLCHRNSDTLSQLHCIKCAHPQILAGKYLHLISEYELSWCTDPKIELRLTASEPQVGLVLAFLIIISLIIVIIAVIVLYRKQGAVYYTHEEERYEDKSSLFSIQSPEATQVKQIATSPFHKPSLSPVTSAPSPLPPIPHSILKPSSPPPVPSTSAMGIRPHVQIYI